MAFSWLKRKKSETDPAESDAEMAVDDIAEADTAPEPEIAPTPDDAEPSDDAVDSPATHSPQNGGEAEKKSGFFGRLSRGLSKTRDILTTEEIKGDA